MTLLDLLDMLGQATWQSVWVPLVAWTVLALPLLAGLKRADWLHPYAEYRLSQALLAALPLGIAAAAAFDVLPTSAPAAGLSGSSVVVLPPVETAEVATTAESSWRWMHAVGLLTSAGLVAAGIQLGRFALDTFAAVRVGEMVGEPPDSSTQTMARQLATKLGLHRPVQVSVTPSATVPGTIGGLRPTILLPPELTETPDALRATLVHECVHIRRWDDLSHVAERLVAAVFAIHPFVESLRRSIVQARERACDAAVLDDGETSRAAYARLLVSFADGSPYDRLGALSLSESSSSLTDRLSAMRSPVSTLLSSQTALSAVLIVVGVGLTIGVAACSDVIGPSSTNPDPQPEAPAESSSTADTSEEEVFMAVEDRPVLVGGMEAVNESVNYPDFARKAGIEGRVIVQFVVDENGNVQNPEVIKGVHEMLDDEAIRTIKAQEFEPGKQRGQPVNVKMSLPVTFDLPDQGADPSSANDVGAADVSKKGTIDVAENPQVDKIGDLPPYRSSAFRIKGGRAALSNQLDYPEFARKAGIEGRVVVSFRIDETGQVQNPRVTEGVHKMLDEAAVEAIQKVSFEPVESINGRTTAEMTLPIEFKLPETNG